MSTDGTRFGRAIFGSAGPIEVRPGGVLALGADTAPFDPGDIASLLAAHISLVRRLQPQQREAALLLRRDDVTTLADLLGETATEVIDRLGALMGATRAQRASMAALFAAGALVIGLGSSGAVTADGIDGTLADLGTLRPPAATAIAEPAVPATGATTIVFQSPAAVDGRFQDGLTLDMTVFEIFEQPALADPVPVTPAAAPVVVAPAVTTPVAVAPTTETGWYDTGATPVLPTGTELLGEAPTVELGPPPVLSHPAAPAPAPVPDATVPEVFEEPTLVVDPMTPAA